MKGLVASSHTNYGTGSSFSKQEHTVINIGDPDGPPRLVSQRNGLVSLIWILILSLDYLRTIVPRI